MKDEEQDMKKCNKKNYNGSEIAPNDVQTDEIAANHNNTTVDDSTHDNKFDNNDLNFV